MRTVVLGGAGNFGARIVRVLCADPSIEIAIAGRRIVPVEGAAQIAGVALDIDSPDFAERLRAQAPSLVIHCVGPFQSQDYRVARAALACGAHYLDLADGRRFVTEFAAALNRSAAAAGRVAIAGASTLPALSSAVVDHLRIGLAMIESIDVTIAPGQQAPRGNATLEAVFGYLGRAMPVWRDGRWMRAWGWMDLRVAHLDIGTRLAAACDVPDLALFPARFDGVRTVRFHAALEFAAQHLALWCLASLRRIGLPVPTTRWAMSLGRLAPLFDRFAGAEGGMAVSIVGRSARGARVRRTWQLRAPARNGPEIPCMATILLARKLARGAFLEPGAFACMGFLTLAEFEPLFTVWGITTRVEEVSA